MTNRKAWQECVTRCANILRRRPLGALIIVAAWSLVGFVACEQQPFAPAGRDSAVGRHGATLAELQRIGEGCAVTERAGDGLERGFAVPRAELPFDLPKIGVDTITGQGDGRVVMVRASRASGAAVSLPCWVSGRASLKQIGDGVVASLDTARWRAMTGYLDRRTPLPDSASRTPLTAAAREFASEMLAPSPAGAGIIGRRGGVSSTSGRPGVQNAPACLGNGDCDCYTVATNYGDTTDAIIVEFSFCDSTDSFDYPWMTANNYYEFPCGGESPDVRDRLAAMYDNQTLFTGSLRPSCDEFRSGVSSHFFSWSEFAVKLQYTYNDSLIGLFEPILQNAAGPDSIRAVFNGALTFTSVYRDPFHNANIEPRGATNSRHMWGDAVDIANPGGATSRPMWDSLYHVVSGLHSAILVTTFDTLQDKACGIECVHADWR